MCEDVNKKQWMDTAILAGTIMMKSGAETYRAEETVSRILEASGCAKAEVFVAATGIIVTLEDGRKIYTVVKRVKDRSTNLANTVQVNEISRKICGGNMKPEEAYYELKKMEDSAGKTDRIICIAIILTTAFFAMLFGGSLQDILLSAFNGAVIIACSFLLKKRKYGNFIIRMVSCLVFVLFTMYFLSITDLKIDADTVITSSAIPLVPGVAFTSAMRDIFHGDYVSGGGKAVEAVVSAISIAVGIGAGLILFQWTGGKIG